MTTQDLIIAALDARGARSWLNPADAATATLVDCERLVRQSYGHTGSPALLQALAEVLALAVSGRTDAADPTSAAQAA